MGGTLDSKDWVDDLPRTEHVAFFKSTDWASTLLGPLDTWGLALRLHTHTLMADTRPAVMYWGPKRVAIYNESMILIVASSHPSLMGKTLSQAYPHVWETLSSFLIQAEATGKAADVTDLQLFLYRNRYVEEGYFTGNFIPIRGDTGKIEGIYSAVHEVTREKLVSRRTALFNLIATPPEQTNQDIGDFVISCLETAELDIPMALLYQADRESTPDTCTLRLIGRIGVPVGHALAVDGATIDSDLGIIPVIREASTAAVVTAKVDERFADISWRGFGEPSTLFSVLRLSKKRRLLGFLVIGMNPRRENDAASQQFLRDLSRHVASAMSSAFSGEESARREQRLMRELAESERHIRYMAQHSAVGMLHVLLNGQMVWANEQFFKLTGNPSLSESIETGFSVFDVILEEDQKKAHEAWDLLMSGQPDVSVELRLKRMFNPPSGDPEPTCVLILSFPYMEDDEVKSIMSCLTDVSRLKWAESLQARNAKEATDARRRQEEFIDVVSHEMRNPLSAMFHCAESIASSMPHFRTSKASIAKCTEILTSNVEAADQILICAKHQKRIIDDVLTLSRLESKMLSIAAVPAVPLQLVDGVVRMFENEFITNNIQIHIIAEASIKENKVDWILCDPSRAAQIFINLLTNAIKFTKGEEQREITIRFGATLADPRKPLPADLKWAPSSADVDVEDPTLKTEWGSGEQLYLTFSIKDTGCGMEPDEIRLLFDRFIQGSAKTHIKYGGSGLGLFISKQLAEAQGGEIGVASKAGSGSTFAFYIKTRRTAAPVESATANNHVETTTSTQKERRLTPLHVLLVEDNKINQEVLRKQLTKQGCVVYVANHGLEALDFIRTTKSWHDQAEDANDLDFILMDLEMPVMNGLDCTRQIRTLQHSGKITRHLDIIAVTANARDEQMDSAFGAGIDDVMPKPFTVKALIEKMETRQPNIAHR